MIPSKTALRPSAVLAVGFAIAALHGSNALAATFVWTGAASQDWANPANWNPSSGVPGASDTARISSNTVRVDATTSVGTLELTGGTLTGAGTLNILVALDWSGSSSMTDTGTTVILPGATATLSGTGDRSLVNGRTLLNRGTLTHSGTCRGTLYNGAHFLNDANASLEFQSDVAWQYTGANPCTWVNLGSVSKSAGAGEVSFPSLVPVNNGTFAVASGSVRFPSGGVATNASFHAAQDAFVAFPDNATFQDVAFNGPGEQRLTGGTITLRGAIQADNLLLSGANLHGSATLAGLLSWSSGPINSGASLTILPGATLRLTGAADRGISDGARLDIQGSLIHSGAGRLTFYNASSVSVAQGGTVDLQSDAPWQYLGASACSVTNSGSFIKSTGTGTNTFVSLRFVNDGLLRIDSGGIATSGTDLHNSGTVRVQSGSLTLAGGGSSSGRFITATGTVVVFTSGTPLLTPGAALAGDGWFRVLGAGLNVVGDVGVPRLELRSGSIAGSGLLSISNVLDWSAPSSMADPGTTVILPGATATLSGTDDRSLVNGRTLLNRGSLIHSGSCRVTLYNGADFLNDANASLDLQSDVAWQYTGATASTWINLGSVTKSAGSGEASFPSLVPVNNGSFSVTSGSLRFPSGVVATNASFHAAQDSFVDYPTDATFQDVAFTGPGEQRLSGGTTQLRGAIQADNLLLSGASIRGAATLAGLFSWSSGPIGSSAAFTLLPGASLRLTGAADRGLTDSSRLTVQGSLVHAGSGRLTFYNAAGISVAQGGTVDLQSDAPWQFLGASTSSITNSGSFIKSAGSGTNSLISLRFINDGLFRIDSGGIATSDTEFNNSSSVRIQAGSLTLSGGGSSSGEFVAATGTVLGFVGGGPRLLQGAALAGDGWVRVLGANLELVGDVGVRRLELRSGSLHGTGSLSVSNLLDWTAPSSMTDAGTTVILPGATATLSGTGDRSLVNGRTLLNRGSLIHSDTCRVTLYNGADFLNAANASLDLQSDVAWQYTGATASTWINLGSVTKSAGSGEASFPSLVPVNNGSFSVASGSLRFPSGVVATNASFHAAQDAFVAFPDNATFQDVAFTGPGEQRITGGTVQLRGAIQADNLLLSGASIRGAATLAGLFSWSSGPISSGAAFTLLPGASLRLTGAADRGLTDSSRLTVQGSLVHAGTGRLTFYNASNVAIAQGGTVDLQSDATWQFLGASASSITNSGSFIKSAGIGTSSIIGLPFHNRGTLGANTGTLSLEIAPSLENGSFLAFSLGGPTHPDGHGRIVTTRSLPLSGHLSVGFRSGYQPSPGQLFTIVGAPVRGTFDSFASSPLAPGNFINPVYETDRIDLVVLGPEPIVTGPGRIDESGLYTLGIRGAVNELYTVEASFDLVEWTPIATNAIPASTLWTFVDADTALWPHRLYRIVHRE